MAVLVVPNAAQLRLIWSLSGALYALNILGVVNTGAVAITQGLANTLGTAIKARLTSSGHVNSISTVISLNSIGIRDLRTANQAEFIDAGAAVPGTLAGDLLPPQVALCITLRTALAGRSFRGRVYLPGFGETSNQALGTAGGGAAATGFIAGIKTDLQTSGLDLGVIHRPTDAPLPVTAGFITPVTSAVLRDLVWDTQRRRAIPGI